MNPADLKTLIDALKANEPAIVQLCADALQMFNNVLEAPEMQKEMARTRGIINKSIQNSLNDFDQMGLTQDQSVQLICACIQSMKK